uniref:CCHC-type domain-containing protein n=1 Tax=Bionectria ochroleuca TaxID=29856 RepID=A0A8H7NNT7_BIOOC
MNNYSGRGGRRGRGTNSCQNLVGIFDRMTTLLVREQATAANSYRNLVGGFGQMTTLLVREQNQERRRRSMRCSNCLKKGHWARECWAPQANAQQPSHARQPRPAATPGSRSHTSRSRSYTCSSLRDAQHPQFHEFHDQEPQFHDQKPQFNAQQHQLNAQAPQFNDHQAGSWPAPGSRGGPGG